MAGLGRRLVKAKGVRRVAMLIADFYPDDAQRIADEDWISEGCRRGWVLLTKDRRIRYRAQELAALQGGFLFCLSDGNANLDAISETWGASMPAIGRAVARGATGFWHVYDDGTIKLTWP